MRKLHVELLILITAITAANFLIVSCQAQNPGIGIGIRKEGPLFSSVGTTISYNVDVYNLGNYWVRNVTITDTFPNGTIFVWQAPDLAPIGQQGDTYNITNILYTIQYFDIKYSNGYPYVNNNAKTNGYADLGPISAPVNAETNVLTFLTITVGGFSFRVQAPASTIPATSAVTYAFLLFIAAGTLSLANNSVQRTLNIKRTRKVFMDAKQLVLRHLKQPKAP